MKINSAVFVALLAAATLPAAVPFASARQKQTICAPVIEQGWIRLLPGGMPMHAGFGKVENRCIKAAAIVSVRSAAYGSIELHETTRVDGVSRMRQLHQLTVEAKGSAVLQPGGLHLMLFDPLKPIAAGERVELRFKLADGREIPASFEARQP